MGKKCSVSDCQKDGKNTALFTFPKDGSLSEKWLDANPVEWTTVKTKYVCMRVIFTEMPRLQELKRKQYLVFLTIDGQTNQH